MARWVVPIFAALLGGFVGLSMGQMSKHYERALTAARDSLRVEQAATTAARDSLADCQREFRAQRARAERAEWRLDLCREGGR